MTCLEAFGKAGTPPVQFTLKLRFGFFVTVAIWENRTRMLHGCGAKRKRASDYQGWFNDDPGSQIGKRLGVVHLCRQALDDGTLVHELKHVIFVWEEFAWNRYRKSDSLDEAAAQEMEKSFVALRSHISEELRLGTI
jgi:hypothetical protein